MDEWVDKLNRLNFLGSRKLHDVRFSGMKCSTKLVNKLLLDIPCFPLKYYKFEYVPRISLITLVPFFIHSKHEAGIAFVLTLLVIAMLVINIALCLLLQPLHP